LGRSEAVGTYSEYPDHDLPDVLTMSRAQKPGIIDMISTVLGELLGVFLQMLVSQG